MKKLISLLAAIALSAVCLFAQGSLKERYDKVYQLYKAKNYTEALPELQALANSRYPEALCLLGVFNEYGYAMAKDESKAFNYYKQAADLGSGYGAYNVLGCYCKGWCGVKIDTVNAKKWGQKTISLLSPLAEKEDVGAITRLGYIYRDGLGVSVDNDKAVHYWEKGAELGSAECCGNLGFCYEHGLGVPYSSHLAREYYLMGWMKGDSFYKRNYALCLVYDLLDYDFIHESSVVFIESFNDSEEIESRKEYELRRGEKLLREVAEGGDVYAMYCYGLIATGLGFFGWFGMQASESDYHGKELALKVFGGKDSAKKWIGKAAEKGYEDAIKDMIVLSMVDQEYGETKKWLEKYPENTIIIDLSDYTISKDDFERAIDFLSANLDYVPQAELWPFIGRNYGISSEDDGIHINCTKKGSDKFGTVTLSKTSMWFTTDF